MNCKPGDTARIIFTPEFPENQGKLVHVESAGFYPGYWTATALCRISTANTNYDPRKREVGPGHRLQIADCILRPVRDPGDDAVDEIILRLGKPTHDEVSA